MAGYAMLEVAEQNAEKNFRFRLDPERKGIWLDLCRQKKISQQDAIEALMDFLFAQDETVQSMLLGQVRPDDDLVEMVLRRLRTKTKPQSRVKPQMGARKASGDLEMKE